MRKAEREAAQARLALVARDNPGLTYVELAQRFGVCPETMKGWCSKLGLLRGKGLGDFEEQVSRAMKKIEDSDGKSWGPSGLVRRRRR